MKWAVVIYETYSKYSRKGKPVEQIEMPNTDSHKNSSGTFNNCTFTIIETKNQTPINQINDPNEPKLNLFIPHYFTAIDGVTKLPVLLMFVRISNDTKSTAVLYPETMSIEVRNKGTWYRAQILETDNTTPLKTDFDESKKVAMGLTDARYLNLHGENKVTYDNPISGWVPVTFENRTISGDIDTIKVNVEDCHSKKFQMQVNLREQRKEHDPSYKR